MAEQDRPYRLYRSAPALRARLRGEPDALTLPPPQAPKPGHGERRERGEGYGAELDLGHDGGRGGSRIAPPGRWRRSPGFPLRVRPWTWKRALKWVAIAVAGWLLLSLVLFVISAQIQQGTLPDSARTALASGPNMLLGTDTVLILGTDQRPAGSKEPGANTSDTGSRSDTIMLWRIGGGTSRRLSIPRDTVAAIPGHGTSKINAAYAYGGPGLAVRTVEGLTGLRVNHLIVVNLAAFPQFIDAIGGIDVTTGRICSDISGGTRNGGFSLHLAPGTHHLSGRDALTLARTRHNACNRAEDDLTRVKRQQQILNAVKSKLLSPTTFFRLPWASWDAPKVLRTDMGGPTLLSLFAASEFGGSAPVEVLKPTGATTLSDGESALTVSNAAIRQAVGRLMGG